MCACVFSSVSGHFVKKSKWDPGIKTAMEEVMVFTTFFSSFPVALAMETPACYPSIALKALKRALSLHKVKESVNILKYRLVIASKHCIQAF